MAPVVSPITVNSRNRLTARLRPRSRLLVEQPPEAAVELARARGVDPLELSVLDLAVEDAGRRQLPPGVVRRRQAVVVPRMDLGDRGVQRRAREMRAGGERGLLEQAHGRPGVLAEVRRVAARAAARLAEPVLVERHLPVLTGIVEGGDG